MKNSTSWEKFEDTGSVESYLSYKKELQTQTTADQTNQPTTKAGDQDADGNTGSGSAGSEGERG